MYSEPAPDYPITKEITQLLEAYDKGEYPFNQDSESRDLEEHLAPLIVDVVMRDAQDEDEIKRALSEDYNERCGAAHSDFEDAMTDLDTEAKKLRGLKSSLQELVDEYADDLERRMTEAKERGDELNNVELFDE